MTNSASQSILFKTLNWLSKDRNFHICIYDTSGVFSINPNLAMPQSSKYVGHNAPFCSIAKSTSDGFKFCIKCKTASIKKAYTKECEFIGKCYLGITEVIRPIFWNKKLICIIYVGNLVLNEDKDDINLRVKRYCKKTGITLNQYKESLKSAHFIDPQELYEISKIIDILEHMILSHSHTFQFGKDSAMHLPSSLSRINWIIDSCVNYISVHYNKELSLSKFANMYFLTPKYFSKLFKDEMGVSFSKYIIMTRINASKRLLESTSESIINISAQTGFNNVTYFNRIFKATEGVTPIEYRLKFASFIKK